MGCAAHVHVHEEYVTADDLEFVEENYEDSADFQTIIVDCDHSSVVTVSGCSSPGSSRYLSASGADSDFLVAVERCPLCLRVRVPLYCTDCLKTGKFTATNQNVRFCELKDVADRRIAEVAQQEERVKQLLKPNPGSPLKLRSILMTVQHLRDVLNKKRRQLLKGRSSLQSLRCANTETENRIASMNGRIQRAREQSEKLTAYVQRKRIDGEAIVRRLEEKRRKCVQSSVCNLFRISPNRPWTEVYGVKIPSVTAADYHVLDSSDHTVTALLFATLFLRVIVRILELNLPQPLDTSVFAKELLTRDEVVHVYRYIVYVVQRLVGHVSRRGQRSQREIVLSDLVTFLSNPQLGKLGPHHLERLSWLPTVNLDADETATFRNTDWVEVPWDIPYDAASTVDSQSHLSNASFISSGASAITSWLGYAFGK